MTIEPERRRRAIYRARYRGTKELDWMLGKFADARVAEMPADELTAFEELLAMPEPDLQKWLLNGTGYQGSTLAGLIDGIRAFHGLEASAQ